MVSSATTNNAANQQGNDIAPVEVQVAALRTAMTKMLHAGKGENAIAALLEVIAQQHHDIARLAKLNDALLRARYGRRSEKLSPEQLGQLALALGATPEQAAESDPIVPAPDVPEEDGASAKPETKPRKGSKKGRHPGRTRLDPSLPRNITHHNVPDHARNCIHCQAQMQPIGHIDYEPGPIPSGSHHGGH